jgi:predicted heme/steroid binding protein
MLIGTDVDNLNETKNFLIGDIANFILADNYVPYLGATKNVDLGIYTVTGAGYIVNGGAATEFLKADGSLDATVYQPAGNYITQLSGEATALGPGNASVTLSNSAVINKVLTGLTITGDAVVATDSILTAFGKVQNQINTLVGGVQYKGTWNAATNTPTLVSSVGVQGNYYVVSVSGNTNLNGITDWKLGDWAIFNGSAWEKVDNTDAVISVNGQIGEVVLTTTDIAEGTNLYYTDLRARSAISLTTTGNSGASTYSNLTGVLNVPNYTLAGLGGVPLTRQLTINGTTFDLSANRTWDVGTVTSVATSGPLTGGTITGSGTIGITQSGASSDGFLSSTDWNTFNNKQNAITNPVTGTGTANTLPMWGSSSSLTNSPLSYAADAFNFGFNSATGGTVNFTNTGLTPYTYAIQMNNFGSPRSTVHSYTDGIVVNSIGGTQVSRMFANGNLILGTGFVDNGYKLEVSGNLYVNSIVNATTDTDRFIVSDGGLIKYRTGAEVLTDIGAQGALTLTTVGTSGAATLISNVLNIPQYTDQFVGTVTSVGLSAPTGFAVSNSPVTSSGTLTLSFASGYSLPTDAVQANWTTAYNDSIISAAVTGTTTKTLTLNQQDGGTITASWTDIAPVTSVFGRLGDIVAQSGDYNTSQVTESGNLYFTNARARTAISLTTTGSSGAATYDSGTGVFNIPNYGSALTGYVPYTGANQTVNLNTQQLQAGHATFTTNGSTDTLTINHTSGSGRGIVVTKSGSGEGLTVVKSSGSGNVASITGGITLLTTLNLTNALADTYIASAANWNTAYNNRITSLTTTGTSGAASLVSHVLNIPQYQAQGNYITSLTGEATASGPGAASVILTNSAVTGKVLTGLTVAGSSIASTDSILTAFGKLQGQVNDLIGGLQYQGTWNASTNTPNITSGVGTDGHFYIVSVAGNTTIDGVSGWQVGDWIVFHAPAWQKVDNTESVVSVNGFTGAVTLTTSNISEGTNLYFTDGRARTAISLTTSGNSGASTYNNGTGVLNVPQYSLAGLGGVPNTRTLTINGTAFDLSADRTWNVGTVTSVATSGPLTGGTITGTGTIGITQASSSSNGFLSSTDWNTFNGKQNTITLTTTGTSGAATLVGATLNIPQYQSVLTNPVTGTGTINYLSKFTGTSAIGNSLLFDNGSALGLNTASINASALFQMDSTTRGFLPPRMTAAQRGAISAPAQGLIVYQTDSVIGLYIYSNSVWRSLTMV